MGIVLDEAVHDGQVPGEVLGDLVIIPVSRDRNASLEVGHFDQELEGLISISERGGIAAEYDQLVVQKRGGICFRLGVESRLDSS